VFCKLFRAVYTNWHTKTDALFFQQNNNHPHRYGTAVSMDYDAMCNQHFAAMKAFYASIKPIDNHVDAVIAAAKFAGNRMYGSDATNYDTLVIPYGADKILGVRPDSSSLLSGKSGGDGAGIRMITENLEGSGMRIIRDCNPATIGQRNDYLTQQKRVLLVHPDEPDAGELSSRITEIVGLKTEPNIAISFMKKVYQSNLFAMSQPEDYTGGEQLGEVGKKIFARVGSPAFEQDENSPPADCFGNLSRQYMTVEILMNIVKSLNLLDDGQKSVFDDVGNSFDCVDLVKTEEGIIMTSSEDWKNVLTSTGKQTGNAKMMPFWVDQVLDEQSLYGGEKTARRLANYLTIKLTATNFYRLSLLGVYIPVTFLVFRNVVCAGEPATCIKTGDVGDFLTYLPMLGDDTNFADRKFLRSASMHVGIITTHRENILNVNDVFPRGYVTGHGDKWMERGTGMLDFHQGMAAVNKDLGCIPVPPMMFDYKNRIMIMSEEIYGKTGRVGRNDYCAQRFMAPLFGLITEIQHDNSEIRNNSFPRTKDRFSVTLEIGTTFSRASESADLKKVTENRGSLRGIDWPGNGVAPTNPILHKCVNPTTQQVSLSAF